MLHGARQLVHRRKPSGRTGLDERMVFGGFHVLRECVWQHPERHAMAELHDDLDLAINVCHLLVELVLLAFVVFLHVLPYGVTTHLIVEKDVERCIVG